MILLEINDGYIKIIIEGSYIEEYVLGGQNNNYIFNVLSKQDTDQLLGTRLLRIKDKQKQTILQIFEDNKKLKWEEENLLPDIMTNYCADQSIIKQKVKSR